MKIFFSILLDREIESIWERNGGSVIFILSIATDFDASLFPFYGIEMLIRKCYNSKVKYFVFIHGMNNHRSKEKKNIYILPSF